MSMVCLSVMLLCYRMTGLGFCNETGALSVPAPVYNDPTYKRYDQKALRAHPEAFSGRPNNFIKGYKPPDEADDETTHRTWVLLYS